MEKEFIPYSEALALKELGFDEQCLALYDLDGKITIEFVNWKNAKNRKSNYLIATPLYQQAFRFFREEYNMLSTIYSNASGWCFEYLDNEGGTHRYDSGYTGDCEMSGAFTSYEKAELACLKKLIEICSKLK